MKERPSYLYSDSDNWYYFYLFVTQTYNAFSNKIDSNQIFFFFCNSYNEREECWSKLEEKSKSGYLMIKYLNTISNGSVEFDKNPIYSRNKILKKEVMMIQS